MPEEFKPVGVIDCRYCKWPSLSWDFICVRCGEDLFPDEHEDPAERHRQENAA
jgi:hypothetical protein